MSGLSRLIERRISFAQNSYLEIAILFYSISRFLHPRFTRQWVKLFHYIYRSYLILTDLSLVRKKSLSPAEAGKPYLALAGTDRRISADYTLSSFHRDSNRGFVSGIHVGVDVLRNGENVYPLEFNVNPAIKPARRALYLDEIDPIVCNVIDHVVAAEYPALYVVMKRWKTSLVEEFTRYARQKQLPIFISSLQSPKQLPADSRSESVISFTEYLAHQRDPGFHFFHGAFDLPVENYLRNKQGFADWQDKISKDASRSYGSARFIPTWNRLDGEMFDTGVDYFPNLLIKFSNLERGFHHTLIRASSRKIAEQLLRINSKYIPETIYSKLPVTRRFYNNLTRNYGNLLFQKFIVPSTDAEGFPEIFRLHFLLSPGESVFLSAHRIVSNMKPYPIMTDQVVTVLDPFIVNAQINSHYEPVKTMDEVHQLSLIHI